MLANGIPPLKSIYFYASGDCNLKCRHCWIEPPHIDRTPKTTPWKKLRPIFESAKELGLAGVKLTGGEPTLHPDITEIISDLTNMQLGVSMETNATLLSKEIVNAFKRARGFISVSLDGYDKESHESLRGVAGSWERALAGMKLLKDSGIGFQVICCLHRGNYKTLYKMPTLAQSFGATSLKVNIISGLGRSNDMQEGGELLTIEEIISFYQTEFKEIRDKSPIKIFFDLPPAFLSLKELSNAKYGICGIMTILGILHDGSAGLCGIGERVSELNFGFPLEVGIDKIWNENPMLNRLRADFPNNLGGICRLCKMKAHCLGKCVAQTYSKTGDLLNGFPFCEEARRLGVFPESRLLKEVKE